MAKDEKQLTTQPTGGLPSIFEDMDRFFGELDPFRNFFSIAPAARMMSQFPKVDVHETENEIKIVANIPGIDPEKVNVEVGADYISLSGRFDRENEEKEGKYYRAEREYGEFRREFSLPARVEKNRVQASSKNGVLTIVLPKSEEEKKTKIRIEKKD